jgi:hypothetical protein
MRTTFTSLILALMLLLSLSGSVLADNAPAGCTKVQGTIVCQTTETVGNAPSTSSAQTTTTTATKKGSTQSSHPTNTTCTGPAGQCR